MNTEPGEALACCLCSKPLTTLPNETAYCRNLKSNPSSFDDWKANSCPMARQSTCLPIVVWKALNASRAPLAAVGAAVNVRSECCNAEVRYRYCAKCGQECRIVSFPSLADAIKVVENCEYENVAVDVILQRLKALSPAAAASSLPAEPPLKPCAKCGNLFRYPPSDNKEDKTVCAYCDTAVLQDTATVAANRISDALLSGTVTENQIGAIAEITTRHLAGTADAPETVELQIARRFLVKMGYARCASAACGCNSWHERRP